MSTTYKTFLDDDVISSRTLLHENIPVSASVIRDSAFSKNNIKYYTHGMFQSVYDYPYSSASSNQLFDLTFGLHPSSPMDTGSDAYVNKKYNIYNQAAQVLVGYDTTGSIVRFDRDGDQATGVEDDKFTSGFFINLSRLLTKDEIKKGSFNLTLGTGPYNNLFSSSCLISDASGTTNYKINSPTGEYGILYTSNFSDKEATTQTNKQVGLLFYQAGIAFISTCVFAEYDAAKSPVNSGSYNNQGQLVAAVQVANGQAIQDFCSGSTINDIGDMFRNRIKNLIVNNTTELNSTIHFCRVGHNDFNYSGNPTYLSGSQIRVKQRETDAPISYITTVGLYSPDRELLAVAKLSEPIKKDPTQELILRVRLDY